MVRGYVKLVIVYGLIGSVVMAGRSLSSVTDESRMNRAGCLVVVLVLASAFLHVKISVKVVRVFLGNVTGFWSTFVLGGGGNVTFHGIQFPREILYH